MKKFIMFILNVVGTSALVIIIASVIAVILSGCASIRPVATIREVRNERCIKMEEEKCIEWEIGGVNFTTPRPAEMSWKKGDTEYTYNTKSESLISKIISILSLGVLSSK